MAYPIVVLTAVKEDPEIELRGGVTAFGGKPEAPHPRRSICSEYRLADLPTGSLTAVSCSEGPIWGMKSGCRHHG